MSCRAPLVTTATCPMRPHVKCALQDGTVRAAARVARNATQADTKMHLVRLSACHAYLARTARLLQETPSVMPALRAFSQTQLPSPPAPNARWDRAHRQRHRRHASRTHPERPTARSVRPGRSVLVEQHLRSCARQADTRIALDRPSVCSASRDATPTQAGPPGAPTAPPDTKLRCRAHQHAHDATRADTKMSRAKLSACHACPARTARLWQETPSVIIALRAFSPTQLR